MKQLRRYFDTVAGWVEELYHHARGHTLIYVSAESPEDGWVTEFDGWARAVYKDKDGKLCIDDLDGEVYLFKFDDIVRFMIGD